MTPDRSTLAPVTSAADATPLRAPLDSAEPRPPVEADRPVKKNYAERLSRALAIVVADRLRRHFPTIKPTPEETGHETPIGGAGGKKRLDVCPWSGG